MAILIKDMEMQKGCATCPYCDRAWNKPKCKAKSVQGRLMEQRLNLDRKRQKWCPLVPVPPHGRLIDGDIAEVISFEEADAEGKDFADGVLYAADFISQMPTIIPAEEAHNGE